MSQFTISCKHVQTMEVKWATRYPHLAESIPAVASVVKQLREQPSAELEARVGIQDNGRFVAGVQRAQIDRILDMMQSSHPVSYTHLTLPTTPYV